MNTLTTTERYARVIEVSKRVRWEIETSRWRQRVKNAPAPLT